MINENDDMKNRIFILQILHNFSSSREKMRESRAYSEFDYKSRIEKLRRKSKRGEGKEYSFSRHNMPRSLDWNEF